MKCQVLCEALYKYLIPITFVPIIAILQMKKQA